MANKLNIPNFQEMGHRLLAQVPQDITHIGMQHFEDSFNNQGFTDFAFNAWPMRKDDMSHQILRKTLALQNDLQVFEMTMQRIHIGTTLPYAAIHNNGGKFSVRVTEKMRKYFWYMYKETKQERWKFMALTKKQRLPIRIPERKFIGESAVLMGNIDKYIREEIVKTFNKK